MFRCQADVHVPASSGTQHIIHRFVALDAGLDRSQREGQTVFMKMLNLRDAFNNRHVEGSTGNTRRLHAGSDFCRHAIVISLSQDLWSIDQKCGRSPDLPVIHVVIVTQWLESGNSGVIGSIRNSVGLFACECCSVERKDKKS